ncbi:MAG TPA: phosphopyruvate hydratase [Bryobacteraceae bacterium]|nr:phosphopyruvate hydratase [Bryobacteraceae bacterium]
MSLTITDIRAWEILDSRGNPTVAAQVMLSDGSTGQAQVPSGASTGRHEAVELRDGDPHYYAGKGVQRAVANVEGVLAHELRGHTATELPAVDRRMLALDGTPSKSRLGANALLGVSCALARALAASARRPLWQILREQFLDTGNGAVLPVPMVNILSGGLHAGSNIEFQDFLVIPRGFAKLAEALEAVVSVHRAARELLVANGYKLTGVADEGGWGPNLETNEQCAEILTQAIARAGFKPRIDMSIAIDVAASHFLEDGRYRLARENRVLDSQGMIELLAEWCSRYSIVSIEDGLAEDDWQGWKKLTATLGTSVQLIGDDLFATNPERLRRGIREGAANAVLVKMNQIGTLTGTFEVMNLARNAGYRIIVSARSGETEDSFLADLAVAAAADQIKIGSITRSERLAKYNRLLELEQIFGLSLPTF